MNAVELEAGSDSFEGLHQAERPTPEPGDGQVRVRMKAAALNYRDLMGDRGASPGPDRDEPVIPLSDGAGIVETGGLGTLERSFQAVAPEGKVSLMGVLAGGAEPPDPYLLMQRRGHLHGISVGHIEHPLDSFRDMNAAIEANDLSPVVDRTFPMQEAAAAYRFQAEGAHFGNVVLTI
jgi:NADPH:quinone reductase-like Zn-dependent oxidoreductase